MIRSGEDKSMIGTSKIGRMLRFAADNNQCLTEWEQEFVDSMEFPGTCKSVKQVQKLTKIYEKCLKNS